MATENISHIFIDLSAQSTAIIPFIKSIADLTRQLYVITVGSSENHDLIYKIKKAGACAFISKESGKIEIEHCLQTIQNEKYYINADVFNTVLNSKLDEQKKRTDIEQQILSQIASGKSIKQICSALELSLQTVINYRRSIMIKLSVNTRQELLEKLSSQNF